MSRPKAKFISARDRLVGKQLGTLANCEQIYDFTKSYINWNPQYFNLRGSAGAHFRSLQEIVKDLDMKLGPTEKDPNKSMLEDFRLALANHAAMEIDPFDPKSREEAIQQIVLCTAVDYKIANSMLDDALMLRAKVYANSLVPTIIDFESEKAAVAAVKAETNSSWSMARDLVEGAMQNLYATTEAEMLATDHSCESIVMNKDRLEKYNPLLDWWKVTRDPDGSLAAQQDSEADKETTRVCGVSAHDATKRFTVGHYQQEYIMYPKIDAVIPVQEELRLLTQQYEEMQTKWKTYINLSVANEVGDHMLYQGNRHKRRSMQSKILRNDVAMELNDALGEMLESINIDENDRHQVKQLLDELKNVEIQTDEYVNRLEDNMMAIEHGESDQIDQLNLQRQIQREVVTRLDAVNAGLQENLDRMRNIASYSTFIMRLVITLGICVSVVVCVFMYKSAAG